MTDRPAPERSATLGRVPQDPVALPDLSPLAEMARWIEAAVALGRYAADPPAGAFSLVEHVWHLADLESEGFAVRIERLRAGGRPVLPDFDGGRLARERNYRARAADAGRDRFAQARTASLALLRAAAADEWSHEGEQEHVGRVTLTDVARMMAEHDASHRKEIAALLGPRTPPWPLS